MGQIACALIEHRLRPEEILELPQRLKMVASNIISGEWQWTNPNIDMQFLLEYWNKSSEYFIRKHWSEKDLALLEKGNMTFHFFEPHLVTFDTSLNWFSYCKNENLINDFNNLTKEISRFLKPVDLIILPDLDDFIMGNECLTVDVFRQKALTDKATYFELK